MPVMNTASRTCALLVIILLLVPLVNFQTGTAQPSTTSTVPTTLWQQNYGEGYGVLWDIPSVTNLIETSDGGFAFLTMGYAFQVHLHPALLFKVNSTGNIQWTRPFESFTASAIIQTSDAGYEISGNWRTPSVYDLKPTLIKTDFNGTIQRSQNYTSVPQLSINPAILPYHTTISTMIKLSDGGYAYVDWAYGSIIKTDSNKQIQWIKNVTYTESRTTQIGSHSLLVPAVSAAMCSLIETSDGALAGLGHRTNSWR